jgi:NADH dehydrogenase
MNTMRITIPDKEARKRIVIIGGGFGGLKVARKLRSHKYQTVLLDENNHHIFQPLLYQVATSGIEPSAISFPYRKIFKRQKNIHIRICEAIRVIPEENLLETSIGTIDYDYLIIATGCSTNYFGKPEYAAHTMALKNTSEALYNRNRILDSIEQAQNTNDNSLKQKLLTYAIVGGGATGIELAGALAEMRKFVLPEEYPDLDVDKMRIILIDMAPRLLTAFSKESSDKVEKYLSEMGVEIMTNTGVVSCSDAKLTLDNGVELNTLNIFWVAGVKANSIAGLNSEAYGAGNRLKVDEFNRVIEHHNIFAIGDTAIMISGEYPKGHPQVVQPAIQQARNLINNLNRIEKKTPLIPFNYKNKGSMATIGRNHAVVELKKIRLSGFLAWGLWLFVHLMSIVGVKNKLFIFLDWMWSYFTYDPSLRVIIKPLHKE